MTDLEPGEIILPLLIGILILITCSYLVSLIAAIPPIRKEAQQNKLVRVTITFALGLVVSVFVFLVVTGLAAETSFESPPHGVVSGIRDGFEHNQGGAVFIDEKTEQELLWDDVVLQYISRERFLRYIRPPFMRHSCYTGHAIACRWADIDLENFGDRQEWIDFLLRLTIGIGSGLMTGFMTWVHTGSKEALQPIEAG